MIKLCDYIGGLLADVSEARQIADRNSVMLSQSYHADEFMKGMPVPHYTIDEAEINVPVMVLGVQPDSGQYAALEEGIANVIRLKLPELLYVVLKNYYIESQKRRKQTNLQEMRAKEFQNPNGMSSGAAANNPSEEGEKIPSFLKSRYRQSVENITAQFDGPMEHFLRTANFEVVKLLDVKDYFCELLNNFILQEFSGYESACLPWQDERQLKRLCDEVGTRIFFEFKRVAQNSRGVMIEPATGKMNEYGSQDCLTYIRLKVREQDVDCIVESDEKGGRRFLSLN